jgi:hypothetical protein
MRDIVSVLAGVVHVQKLRFVRRRRVCLVTLQQFLDGLPLPIVVRELRIDVE